MKFLRLAVWRALVLLAGVLLAGACSGAPVASATPPDALDVSLHDRVTLTRWARICSTDAAVTLEQLTDANCRLEPATSAALTRGFERGKVWLQFTLVNRSAQSVERILSVGHPRIELVTLYRAQADASWQTEQAGAAVALNRQNVKSASPSFAIQLAPGQQQTLWVSVWSRSVMNLTVELASPQQASYRDVAISILQAAAMGSLLLCCIFGLGWFVTLRDRASLYFALYIAGEFITEAARTGFLRLYFWPRNTPYPIEALTVGTLIAITFLLVFLRAYIPHLQRYRQSLGACAAAAALYFGGVVWALALDYRSGTWFWTWAIWFLILTLVNLLIQAARDKIQEAQIVLGCAALTVCFELIRLLSILGYLPFGPQMSIMGSWTFVLSTLILLLNVSQRSWQLQRTLSSAETEAEQRLRFMSSMGHELRAPLNAIIGHTRLIERAPRLEAERAALPAIRLNAQQMLSMIDDILDYSQGKNQHLRLHLRAVRWGTLVDQMVRDAHALAGDEAWRLHCQIEGERQTVLLVDQRRLLQVVHNLIGNALRHAPGAAFGLRCVLRGHQGAAPDAAWQADFEVWDAGPGIAESDQDRVFEPFHRGRDAHLAHVSGLGMGLAISRQLVRAMGADLTLHSRAPEPGCRFCFGLTLSGASTDELLETEQAAWPASHVSQPGTPAPEPQPVLAEGSKPDAVQLARLLTLLDNGQVSELLDALSRLEPQAGLGAFTSAAKAAVMQLDFDAVRVLCGASNSPPAPPASQSPDS